MEMASSEKFDSVIGFIPLLICFHVAFDISSYLAAFIINNLMSLSISVKFLFTLIFFNG